MHNRNLYFKIPSLTAWSFRINGTGGAFSPSPGCHKAAQKRPGVRHPSNRHSVSNTPNQPFHITMVAFALLRASFFVVGLLAPAALAVPAADKTALTPFGERPAGDVHAVPEGVI
jgi:hypothetical protein